MDGDLARRLTGAALESENWHVSWFQAFYTNAVGEDFRSGQPLAKFMALAFCGAALFLTPRLLKRGDPG